VARGLDLVVAVSTAPWNARPALSVDANANRKSSVKTSS
jgi:hypothetical protein